MSNWLGSSPPPAPDYTAAANAQGAANVDTARVQGAINNPNEVGPYGSRTWQADPAGGDRSTVTTTLSPDEQAKLNLSNSSQIQGLTSLNNNMGKVDQALSSSYTLPGSATTSFDPKYVGGAGGQTQLDPSMANVPGLQGDVNLSGVPGLPGSADDIRNRAEAASYSREQRMLDPQYQQQQAAMASNLANQGIRPGSEAFKQAMDDFARQRDSAYGDARDRAILLGGQESDRSFGQDMSRHQVGTQDVYNRSNFINAARNQGVNENLAQQQGHNAAVGQNYNIANMAAALSNSGRAQSLQELINSKILPINVMDTILNGGKVNSPQFQPYNNNTQIEAPPLYNATVQQGNYNAGVYNAQQGATGNLLNAAGRIGAAAAPYLISDRRLKSDIKQIGTRNGHKWYSYKLFGQPAEGVMADEVAHVPGAVHRGSDGYLRVDYSKLGL